MSHFIDSKTGVIFKSMRCWFMYLFCYSLSDLLYRRVIKRAIIPLDHILWKIIVIPDGLSKKEKTIFAKESIKRIISKHEDIIIKHFNYSDHRAGIGERLVLMIISQSFVSTLVNQSKQKRWLLATVQFDWAVYQKKIMKKKTYKERVLISFLTSRNYTLMIAMQHKQVIAFDVEHSLMESGQCAAMVGSLLDNNIYKDGGVVFLSSKLFKTKTDWNNVLDGVQFCCISNEDIE